MRTWQGWPVVEMRLADLRPVIGQVESRPNFQRRLRESILSEGMRNPLICAVVTPAQWRKHWDRRHAKWALPRIETAALMVIVGNQRLAALQELGHTHADCVVCPDVHAARGLSTLCKEGFESLYDEEAG